MNTKRARMHPVYKDKPPEFRIIQGSFYIKKKEEKPDKENEIDETGEQGTVSEESGYDPKKPLKIAGVANANIIDRMDEIVDPRGGDFVNFMKNPVLLADHMYWSSSVVGAVLEMTPEESGTSFVGVVGDPTKAPLTTTQEEIRNLIAQGFIKTVSIGFIPQKIQAPTFDDQGRMVDPAVILNWELLELSVVAVPANPDATFEMKSYVENKLTLNTNRFDNDKSLTSYGQNVKNEGSGNQENSTEKGFEMTEEQMKELLEGVAGIATGMKAMAEMQQETLNILKATGEAEDEEEEEEEEESAKEGNGEEEEEDKEKEDKEKAFEALADTVKSLKEQVEKMSAVVVRLYEKSGLADK